MPIRENPNIASTAVARCVLRLMTRRWRSKALLKLFFIGNHGKVRMRLR